MSFAKRSRRHLKLELGLEKLSFLYCGSSAVMGEVARDVKSSSLNR